jgi:hypothetical protein
VAARSLRVAHDLFVGADTFHTHILDCSHIAAVSDPRLIQLVREALNNDRHGINHHPSL